MLQRAAIDWAIALIGFEMLGGPAIPTHAKISTNFQDEDVGSSVCHEDNQSCLLLDIVKDDTSQS